MNSLRCDVCNYCRATDGPRHKVEVIYDPGSQSTLCTDCVKAIWPTPEPDKTADGMLLGVRPLVEQRDPPAPTLPGVHGVNDGPYLDMSMWSTDDEEDPTPAVHTEQDREISGEKEVPRDLRGTFPAEGVLSGEEKIFTGKG